jgi:hypothetical protein
MAACPFCRAFVRDKNLPKHFKKVHPGIPAPRARLSERRNESPALGKRDARDTEAAAYGSGGG